LRDARFEGADLLFIRTKGLAVLRDNALVFNFRFLKAEFVAETDETIPFDRPALRSIFQAKSALVSRARVV
jgi:hypothetical protein